MLFVTCLLSLFACQSVVFAELSGRVEEESVCKKQLEEIVYHPDSYYFDYLDTIAPILLRQIPLIFQSPIQTPTIVQSFSTMYGVVVELRDAMGNLIDLDGTTTGPFVFDAHEAANTNLGHVTGRANGVGEAFSNVPASVQTQVQKSMLEASPLYQAAYVYQKIVWNVDGRMLYVKISLPKTDLDR